MNGDGAIWCAFAEAVRFPDQALLASIRSGAIAERLRGRLTQEQRLACGEVSWAALQDVGDSGGDLPVEYTRLFDKAAGGKCSLNDAVQHGPQMKTMEEVVRFYNHFGVAVADEALEMPDHLAIELEFLHCLAYGEADHISRGEDASHYARARRDFIARHPGRLVSQVCRRLPGLKPMPYYTALFRLLDRCLRIDLEWLETRFGPASLENMHSRYCQIEVTEEEAT